MSPFQIVVILLAGCIVVGTLIALFAAWLSRREALTWALVWTAVAVAVAWPGLVAVAAKGLGIGRGADLVLYCFVIVTMVGFFMIYARLRAVRRELTLLVRRLAIRDALSDIGYGGQPTEASTPEED